MAKLKLKKPSKRQPARQRYKIQKKIRQHNKKLRREARKTPNKNKGKQHEIQIPNICPFKENILKEVEEMKKLKEEERQRKKEELKMAKEDKLNQGLEGLVTDAEIRNKIHDNLKPTNDDDNKTTNTNKDKSVKAYYKEFRKVINSADVILEVVDARDPIGTRCKQVEETIRELHSNKRLILIINKSDLVPRKILDKWLKYFKTQLPTIPFKASTQDQNQKLCQKKFTKSDKTTEGSSAVGTEILLSLLANYCRNKNIKTLIRVGVVGLPNVGKSSIINSLKRSKACNVGSKPGITRTMQEVQLDSKIKLLDSPGIVFSSNTNNSDNIASLRNAINITQLSDPITPANAILQRVTKPQMMQLYDINKYSSPEEFYSLVATRMGRFKRGGVPDKIAAARQLLEDWNSGKIKYYTVPPPSSDNQISSTIVQEIGKEFDLNSYEAMQCDYLDQINPGKNENENDYFEMETLGEVKIDEELLADDINIEIPVKKSKNQKNEIEKSKENPELKLEGNQQLNKIRKTQFKKEKKSKKRKEKIAKQLADGLNDVSIKSEDSETDYNFDTDFQMK